MIIEAAKKAKIDKLVVDRKEIPVGPNGSQLSGGQKQRIIVRVFKPALICYWMRPLCIDAVIGQYQ